MIGNQYWLLDKHKKPVESISQLAKLGPNEKYIVYYAGGSRKTVTVPDVIKMQTVDCFGAVCREFELAGFTIVYRTTRHWESAPDEPPTHHDLRQCPNCGASTRDLICTYCEVDYIGKLGSEVGAY